MQNTDIEKTKSFLEGHDYIVRVYKTNEGCKAIFPYPKISKPNSKREEVEYNVKRDKEPGVYVNEEFWSAPNYALRLMITCDIINRMRKIPIHESLVSYYNSNEEEVDKLADLISSPSNAEDRKKEGFLAGLLSKAVEDKFIPIYDDIANTPEHDVSTGYRLLKSFF